MKVILQRVSQASVEIEGKIKGKINKGIVVLVGIHKDDDIKKIDVIDKMADKIVNVRIFEDEDNKMNLSLKDVDGELLIISNFTLYGDMRKGTRPSYSESAKQDLAKEYYDKFIEIIKTKGIKKVETGEFGADMKVSILNDGPVTLEYEL